MQRSILPLVIGLSSPVVLAQQQIFFSVTYRDFLPADCLATFQIDTWRQAWGLNAGAPENVDSCDLLIQDLQFRNAIENGIISGHPDFETETVIRDSLVCGETSNADNVVPAFPLGSCEFVGDQRELVQQTLTVDSAGLPKLKFCDEETEDPNQAFCGNNPDSDEGAGRTQSNRFFFESWYADDLKFNRRVGQRLALTEDSNGQFVFDSGTDSDAPDFFDSVDDDLSGAFFGPLTRFKNPNGGFELELSDFTNNELILQSVAFPRSEEGNDRGFWFTTELHTTFEYNADGNMVFSFSGDDDFWAFVNGQMVIDLGGLHVSRTATIDLNGNVINPESDSDQGEEVKVADLLGLVDGEVYTLDVFHAERQTQESTFVVTTSLVEACNAQEEGTEVFNFNAVNKNLQRLTSRNVDLDENSNSFVLSDSSIPFETFFVYTEVPENVGAGFVTTFDVKIPGNSDGFAFVLQADRLENYPPSSGAGFNFKGLKNTVAVVFDLCVDREENPDDCNVEQVSIHYEENPEDPIDVSERSLRTNAQILRRINRDEFIKVEIIQYGGRPDFLEVYIDNSLYLRESNFDIIQRLGGNDLAFVGLTSVSGIPGDQQVQIEIQNWELRTVDVDPAKSALVSPETPSEIFADGVAVDTGFGFETFDACETKLSSGGLEDFISGFFVEAVDENGDYPSGNLFPVVIPIGVVDDLNGGYSITFQADIATQYNLTFTFGDSCEVVVEEYVDDGSGEVFIPDVSIIGEDCFEQRIDGAVDALERPIAPTVSPTPAPVLVPGELPIVAIASSTGSVVCLLLIAAIIMAKYRRRWNIEKVHINTGRAWKIEQNTTFAGGDEYSNTGKELLATQQTILELQAQADENDPTKNIARLQAENQEIRDWLKDTKRADNGRLGGVALSVAVKAPKKKKKYGKEEI